MTLFAELFLPHSGAQWLGLMPGEGNEDENYVHINLLTIGVFEKLDDCSNANMGVTANFYISSTNANAATL